MDTAVWLGECKGEKGKKLLFRHDSMQALAGSGQMSVGHHLIEALRGIGVLDELVETSERLIVYPKKMQMAR